MRAGDPSRFAIEVEGVAPRWAKPGETWVGLRIYVQGRNLLRHSVGQENVIQESLYVEIGPILEWWCTNLGAILHEEGSRFFAIGDNLVSSIADWRRASLRRFEHDAEISDEEVDDDERRQGWERRHFLRFANTGAWLPNLAFARRDREVVIAWEPHRTAGSPAAYFLEPGGVAYVAEGEFLDALARFFEAASGQATSAADLRALAVPSWTALIHGAALGEAEFLEGLRAAAAGREPLDSVAFLAARDLTPEATGLDALRRLEDAIGGPPPAKPHVVLTTWFASNGRAEDDGYGAAEQLRDMLDLDGTPLEGDALDTFLADRCGVQMLEITPGRAANHMVCGARVGARAAIGLIGDPAAQRPWVRRMEQARGLAHILLDRPSPSGVIGAGDSKVAAGLRRRRSGAFAAELLMPASGIRNRIGTALDAAADPNAFQGLLRDFGVGAQTAAFHLWNRGFLSSRRVRDELIEEFASPG